MHTNQRAAVLQRKAREAEVDAAVEATERFMADAAARFPAGPPAPGPPPMPPPGPPPPQSSPPGPTPARAATGVETTPTDGTRTAPAAEQECVDDGDDGEDGARWE